MTYDSVQEFEDSIATIDKESEKMKKVEFACAAEVTDDTVLKLTKTFGQTLEVLEFQTVNPGNVTENQVVKIIRKSSSKSCFLDPWPIFLCHRLSGHPCHPHYFNNTCT